MGAVLRYWAALLLVARLKAGALPAATLLINLAGSFALGIVLGVVFGEAPSSADVLHDRTTLFLAVGICGSFTTFSTFATEIGQLFPQRDLRAVAWYIGLTLAGVIAVFLVGLGLGSLAG